MGRLVLGEVGEFELNSSFQKGVHRRILVEHVECMLVYKKVVHKKQGWRKQAVSPKIVASPPPVPKFPSTVDTS